MCVIECGVIIVIEKNMVKSLDLTDEIEWDTKTLASAVKAYFRYIYKYKTSKS